MSFYWYDLETSGTDPRWDRIVQFAGFRTDENLNPIGDEYCTYVRLPDDVLPNPDASLVTGITPELTLNKGISEWQALTEINRLFTEPRTCAVGYNSLRFDDEFMRYGLYRMLLDPYAREWQNNNSRWDLIDLVRAAGALRRDGIEWPNDEDGLPVYKLESLAAANGLEHGHAHDALSDVHATVALARLIKTRQPKLFKYYYDARFKRYSKELLEPYGARVCVHVSGMYPRERYGTAPVVSICRHPTNSNAIVVADLSQDVEPMLAMSAAEIRDNLFVSGSDRRPPLKEIRINRCPFVAGLEVLTPENWDRLGFDRREIQQRQRRLKQPGLAQRIMKAYGGYSHDKAPDPEGALYEGFLQDEDRSRCVSLQSSLRQHEWQDLDYRDRRLVTLAERLKARSFPELMNPEEVAAWRDFVRDKLMADSAPWLTLAAYRARLETLLHESQPDDKMPDDKMPDEKIKVLKALEDHGSRLRSEYGP